MQQKTTHMISLISVLMTLALLFAFVSSASAADIIAQGECGENGSNLTWTLTNDGVLMIEGNGAMRGWDSRWYHPDWAEYKNSATSLVIKDGVTTIGESAFSGFTSLTEIRLPDTLTEIETAAFSETVLPDITLPDSVRAIGSSAFEGASIQQITLPEALTEIASYCFKNAELKEIILPDSVRTIGGSAFRNSSLSKITMSQNLTSIGSYAFENCRKLTSVTLPEKLESIDSYAFENCTGLSELNINSRNVTTKNGIFNNTGANRPEVTVTFGDMVKTIPEKMFYTSGDYPRITTLHVGKNVTSIGSNAFSGCKKLKNVTMDEDAALRSIGNYAFSDCSALETAILPENMETVSYAFKGCTSMKQLTVYAQNLTKASYAFEDAGIYAKTFEVVFADSVLAIPKYMFGDTSTRENPSCGVTSVTLGKNVASIGASAFQKCDRLETVTIPEDSALESIGESAFENCKALTAITLPKSLRELHSNAFKGCSYLESVTVAAQRLQLSKNDYNIFTGAGASADELNVVFEDDVAIAPSGLFNGTAASSVSFGKGIEEIGASAFEDCEILRTVTIPQDCALKTIGASAFEGCTSLTAITLPQKLTALGDYAFYNCTRLGEISFYCENLSIVADGVETYKNYQQSPITPGVNAFAKAGAATGMKVSFFAPAKYVPGNLFASWTRPNSYADYSKTASNNLTEVFIDSSVKNIGVNAFSHCEKLKTVTFAENSSLETIYRCAFEDCAALKEISLPETLTDIGACAFQDCAALETAAVPPEGALRTIWEEAFLNCKALTSFVFPAALEQIGEGAFRNCVKLSQMDFYARSLADFSRDSHYSYPFSNVGSETDGVKVAFLSPAEYVPAALFYPNTSYFHDQLAPKVTEAVIDASVKQIASAAFAGCSDLNTIRILNRNCEINSQFGDHTVIEGYKNSEAHYFAELYGYDFRPIPAPFQSGDVDHDGQITAADARLALRAAVGLEQYETGGDDFAAADADRDNQITAADARMILRAAVGLEHLE